MMKREKEEVYENKFFDIETAFDQVEAFFKKFQ